MSKFMPIRMVGLVFVAMAALAVLASVSVRPLDGATLVAQSAGKGKAGDKPADKAEGKPDSEKADGAGVPDYEAVKVRDLLSTDYMMVHPDGLSPSGVTPEEAQLVRETLAGGIRVLLEMQDANGVMNTYHRSNKDEKQVGYGSQRFVTGAHALALWTLIASGAQPSSPAVKAAAKAMVGLAMSGGQSANDEVKGKAVSNLWNYELSLILMAFHSLATERLEEAKANEAEKDEAKRGSSEKKPPRRASKKAKDDSANEGALLAASLLNQLSKSEQACAKAVYEVLLASQLKNGGWDYRASKPGARVSDSGGDSSNVHFAMLGILSAYRTGLGAPKTEILERAAQYWMSAQQADGPLKEIMFRDPKGDVEENEKKERKSSSQRKPKSVSTKARGFGYTTLPPQREDRTVSPTLSMSAAGVICLAIVRYLTLGGEKEGKGVDSVAKIDVALKDGLAYLAHVLPSTDPEERADDGESAESGEKNPEPPEGAYRPVRFEPAYTMLAIERAGILNGCDTFGRCEWYPLGVRVLLPYFKAIREYKVAGAGEEKAKGGKKGDRKEDRGRKQDAPDKDPVRPSVDTNTCMHLLFLKGYLDKTPTVPKGPVITGGGKKIKEAETEPAPPQPEPPKPEPAKPQEPVDEPAKPEEPAPPAPPEDPLPPEEPPLDQEVAIIRRGR